jgi:hypothetical protein
MRGQFHILVTIAHIEADWQAAVRCRVVPAGERRGDGLGSGTMNEIKAGPAASRAGRAWMPELARLAPSTGDSSGRGNSLVP